MGTQPDAVIVCINLYDEIDYINRTISFIEMANQSRIIALAALPLIREDNVWGAVGKKRVICDRELEEERDKLLKKTGLRVYYIGIDQEESDLAETIIDYFGGK